MGDSETQAATVVPVAVVRASRREAIDDDWGEEVSTITLVAGYDERSLTGLAEFSHLEVVYLFDRVDADGQPPLWRVPRGNPAWPEVGIFAQRAKDRPNRIGVSRCELLSVEGTVLTVRGLDAIDGTPVLDVKPFMVEFGPRGPVRQPAWATELMAGYY